MPNIEHITIPLGEIHRPHNWEYADATARAAATPDLSEVGLVALQLDNGTLWQLTGVSPTAWMQIGGGGASAVVAAGTQTATSGTVNFANSNGITFGMSGSSQITASHNALTSQSVQTQSIVNAMSFSGNTAGVMASISSGTAILAGGNNITLSQNGNSVTISGANQSVQTQNLHNVSLSGNTAGVMAQVSSGTLILAGGNNITLSQNGNSVTISGPSAGGAQTGISGIFAGTQTQTSGTLSFANSNGITFGLSNSSVLTASHNGITSQTVQTQSTAAVLGSTGNVSFANSNGITFGGNASTITASHNGITSQTVQTQGSVAVQGSSGNISFSNSNGITFGFNASTITASHNGITSQTVQSQNVHNVTLSGNTAGVMAQVSSGTLTLAGGNNITLSQNGNAITISGPNVGGAQTGISGIFAGTQTQTVGTLSFANSNGITFGLSNSSVLTASHNGLTTAAQSNHSHGNPTLNLTNLSGTTNSNSAGFTLSLSAPSMPVVSVDGFAGLFSTVYTSNTFHFASGLGNLSFVYDAGAIGGYVADTGFHYASGTTYSQIDGLLLSNANGVTLGTQTVASNYGALDGGDRVVLIVTASHNAITSQTVQTQSNVQGLSAGTQVGRTGDVVFANSNGISFGMSGSSQITASYTVPTIPGATVFSNSNNVSFGLNGSTVTATATFAQTTQTQNLHNVTLSGNTAGVMAQVSSGTLTLAGGNNITLSQNGNAITISGPNVGGAQTGISGIFAGTQTQTVGTLSFANSNGITFGLSNSSVLTASHNGITSQTVQTQSTAAVLGSTGNISFANSNGITFGGNASTVTASHNGITSQTVQTQSNVQGLSAGTQVGRTGDVVFANSNGISFGMSGSSQITASYTVPTIPGATVFSNSNNVSFGLNGSTVTATATFAQTTQTQNLHNVTLSGNTAGVMAQVSSGTLTLAGGNNITLSQNGNAITISGPNTVAQSVQTQNMVSVQGSTGNISFSNSNGITFGFNASTITASHNGLTSQSNQAFSAQGGSSAFQTLVFTNSNGVSFSNTNGSIWASVAPQTTQTQNLHNVTLSGNTAGVMAQVSSGTLTLAGGNNITLSQNGNAITISGPNVGGAQTGISGIFAGTQTQTVGTLSFADSNGITFGLSNSSVLTASHNALTTAALSNHSHGNPTLNLTNLSGTTASNSAGLTLSLSAAAAGVNPVASASNGSFSFTTLAFSNGNNVTFGTSAGSIISASVAAQTVQTQSTVAVQGSTGNISFSNSNGITFGFNASTITASHNGITSQTVQTQSNVQGLSAGTQVGRTGDIVFANSNGISFGMSGSSQITASYTVPTVPGATVFSNSNNVSFGLNGSTVTATATFAQTTQTQNVHNVTLSGNTAGVMAQVSSGTLTLAGGNNITLSQNGNAVTISGPNTVAQTVQTQNMVSVQGSTGNISFSNSNGITFGFNASTITASHNGLTSQSNQAFSAQGGSSAFQTLVFTNSNGVSFSNTNGSIWASVAAQTNQSIGVYGSSQTTGQSSSSTVDARSLTFRGMGGVSVGLSAGEVIISGGAGGGGGGIALANSQTTYTSGTAHLSVVGGAMTIASTTGQSFNFSVPATSVLTGVGGISISTNGSTISISNGSLSAYAVSNTTQSSSGIVSPSGLSFQGAGGVSVGVSNGSVVISGGAGGGGATLSGFNPYADIEKIAGQYGAGTLQFDPVRAPNFQMDRILIPIINTNATNSSGSHTLSFWVGVYSRNASTLSLVFSASGSTAVTHSGTVGSYSLYSGNRMFTIPATTTLTEGDYWLGFVSRTTSGGANGTYSNLVASNIASNYFGLFGSSHNTTMQLTLGQGLYTVTTSGMPGSVAFSQIRGSDSAARRAAFIMFGSSTV